MTSLFIKVSQILPLGVLPCWFPCPLDIPPSFLRALPTFWHSQRFQHYTSHAVLESATSSRSLSSMTLPHPSRVTGRCCLEIKSEHQMCSLALVYPCFQAFSEDRAIKRQIHMHTLYIYLVFLGSGVSLLLGLLRGQSHKKANTHAYTLHLSACLVKS